MSRKQVELIIIDPQNDFCDKNGALFVPGADDDIIRLATMIERCKNEISDIHTTLDMHHFIDIAHPIFWKDENLKHPAPFTIITSDEVKNGKYRTTIPNLNDRAIDYLIKLEASKRYPHCIWPPHCLIGSWGASVSDVLFKALLDWETQIAMVDYVTKGSNYLTEHFSAVMAEVEDPEDPGTQLNINLVNTLQKADIIGISGQALSHCVKFTVEDIANNFGEENIKKFVLLEDTTSPVETFEKQADEFVSALISRGMSVMKSTDFLK